MKPFSIIKPVVFRGTHLRIAQPILFLLLFTISLVSGCTQERPSVVVLPYLYTDDPFIKTLTDQLELKLGESYQLTIEDSRNSQIIQNEFIETAIHNGADLLIINPVDRLGVYPIIRRLKEENIPVIFYNREPLSQDMELWDQVYYVGALADQSGRLQAEMVAELFPLGAEHLGVYDKNKDNKIQLIIFKGEQGHQDAEIRTSTVTQSLKDMGYTLDIIATEPGNWSYSVAYELMGTLLDNHKEAIELIISNNDAMALGAIAQLRQQGYFQDSNNNNRVDKDDATWIPIVGIDGIPEAVEHITSGHLYGTVINDAEQQAEEIYKLAQQLLAETPDYAELTNKDQYVLVNYKMFRIGASSK